VGAVRRNVRAVAATERPLLFVLRALGLGDFLVGVPAYRALRRAFPAHELRLATTGGVAPLAGLVGGIDSVAPARGPDDFAAPERPVDIAVNLHGKGPQSTRSLAALRPRRLIAFHTDHRPVWDDDWAGSERARWTRLLASSGIPADPLALALDRPDVASPAPGAVVVHPGAAYGSRRWPADRFAAVARALQGTGHRVVVTGTAAEAALARHVIELAGLPADALLAGRTDVLGLAALVADAALVVCGDTGPAHLATAYATPSVVLFGPTPPQRWGPPARRGHVALWPPVARAVPPDPWGAGVDPALASIHIEDVLAAAARLLSKSTALACG
jgi:ADP-heptose:LPS heptosyltransferase